MKAHIPGKVEVIFLRSYNHHILPKDAKWFQDVKFAYSIWETTHFFYFLAILCCLPWSLINFEFQHYNIKYNFLIDQPWQVRYQMKAHNTGRGEVILLWRIITRCLPRRQNRSHTLHLLKRPLHIDKRI